MSKVNIDDIIELMNSWRKPLVFKDIHTFIKEHDHIQYCEAVMNTKGELAYVSPSHQEALIEVTGKTMDEVMGIMPVDAHSLTWLVEYTSHVAVWYNGCIAPKKMSIAQLESLKLLLSSGVIASETYECSFGEY